MTCGRGSRFPLFDAQCKSVADMLGNVEGDIGIHDQESYGPFLQMDVKRGVSAVVEPSLTHGAGPRSTRFTWSPHLQTPPDLSF